MDFYRLGRFKVGIGEGALKFGHKRQNSVFLLSPRFPSNPLAVSKPTAPLFFTKLNGLSTSGIVFIFQFRLTAEKNPINLKFLK